MDDDGLVLYNGMTRASRIAKLAPGTLIRVEVVGELKRLVRHYPKGRRLLVMIDPTRRELLRLIEELSAACPEYRFGQLVLNLAFMAREDGDRLAWNLEDAEFVAAARKHLVDWYASHGKSDDALQSNQALAKA